MRYMGNKNRLSKQLLPFVLKDRRPNQVYVEPFLGSGGIFQHVENPRIGSDMNRYLVSLLIAVRDGWIPPELVTEEDYKRVKAAPEEDWKMTAFVGYGCSFAGKWFAGYARDRSNANYARQARDSLLKQATKLEGAELLVSDYRKLAIPPQSLIYCDPPYDGTTKYAKGETRFDYDEFWAWCEEKRKEGHAVFVSEYKSKGRAVPIWEREVSSSLDCGKRGGRSATERLFWIP